MAVVYQHRRLDNGQVFYIGIGKTVKRAYTKSKARVNNYWHNIVNKVDFEVEILYDNISWDRAKDLEIWLIAEFGIGRGSQLVNLTLGGDGVLGYKHTDEFKEKIGSRYRGKHLDDNTVSKMRKSNTYRAKPIIQYSLKGDYIAEYPSINEAIRQTGADKKTLSQHLRGKYKSAKGFTWQYK